MPKCRRKKKQSMPYDKKSASTSQDQSTEDPAEETFTCSSCSKSVDQILQCEYCLKWYCCTCQNVCDNMMSALTQYKSLHWYCTVCDPIVQNKISTPSTQNPTSTFQEEIKTCIINSMEKAIESMSQVMQASIAKTFQSFSPSSSSSPKSLPVVAASRSMPEQPDVNGAIDEYLDRQRRKCNVIVRNLPEPAGKSTSECTVQDIEAFKEIANHELKAEITSSDINKVVRLGKLSSKPRLLLVSLSNEQSKSAVLKSAFKLKASTKWSNLYISADLTPRERVINHNLRTELKQRRNGGEKNLYIRKGKLVTIEPSQSNIPPPSASPMEEGTQQTQQV